MKSTRFEVLSGQEINEIKQATLEVLEQAGLKVEVKKMRGILADLGCTVDEKTRIVKFPPRVVETYVAKAPREFVLCGHDRSLTWKISPETRVWGGLGTAVNMYNLQTGAYAARHDGGSHASSYLAGRPAKHPVQPDGYMALGCTHADDPGGGNPDLGQKL